MFLKKLNPREFEYRPRFYEPLAEEDENENRIKFKKLVHKRPLPKRSFLGMVVIIIILIFLVRYLFKISSKEKDSPIEQIKIEIIE